MGKDAGLLEEESKGLMACLGPRLTSLTIATSTTALAFLVTTLLGPNFAYGQAVQKITIGYPAFSLTFLTFFVAKDAGIFKKNGFDVDLVQLAGAVQTSALVAGEIDYLTGITGPLVAAARGLPFKGIMITHDRPLFWVIGSAEIRKVEDLLGKTDRKSTRLNSSHLGISYAVF